MAKFYKEQHDGENVKQKFSYLFHCPGCGLLHSINTIPNIGMPCWTFNGDVDNPTISPSLRVRWEYGEKGRPEKCCHSFIKDGKIQFLSDCTHELKNQTVEIPDWDQY